MNKIMGLQQAESQFPTDTRIGNQSSTDSTVSAYLVHVEIKPFNVAAEWGERDENGTWSGMLGELHRGAKDLAINYFTVTTERAEDFDYSVPYYNEGSVAV